MTSQQSTLTIPKNWIATKLSDVVFFQEGPGLRSYQFKKTGMKVLNVTNIVNGKLDLSNTDRHIDLVEFKIKYSHFAVEENDIVMASSGATYGKTAFVEKKHLPLMMNTSVIRLHPFEQSILDRKFLNLFLNSTYFKYQINKMVTGSAQPNFGPTHLERICIIFPSIDEQKRIISKIEELFSISEYLKNTITKNLDHVKKIRNSILKYAFTGKLVEQNSDESPVNINPVRQKKITGKKASVDVKPGKSALSIGRPNIIPPKGWKWVPLLDVSELASGHTPSRKHPEYWDGQIPWVTGGDAGKYDGEYIFETKEKITQLGIDNSAAVILPVDTVCLAREASIGYCVLLGKPMATNQRFVNFICGNNILPKYLMYLFLFERSSLFGFGEGTTFGTVYFPAVKSFHVCLPPISEQKRIVSKIETSWSLTKKMEQEMITALHMLKSLQNSLQQYTFNGKLVPQDLDEQIMPLLLENIKQGKERMKEIQKVNKTESFKSRGLKNVK